MSCSSWISSPQWCCFISIGQTVSGVPTKLIQYSSVVRKCPRDPSWGLDKISECMGARCLASIGVGSGTHTARLLLFFAALAQDKLQPPTHELLGELVCASPSPPHVWPPGSSQGAHFWASPPDRNWFLAPHACRGISEGVERRGAQKGNLSKSWARKHALTFCPNPWVRQSECYCLGIVLERCIV